MYSLFYAVGEVRPGDILCFQYMFAFYVFQHGHLLNGYLVEFLETFTLRQTFIDKDRIEVLHVAQTNQLVNRRVVAYIASSRSRVYCLYPPDEHRATLWLLFRTKLH